MTWKTARTPRARYGGCEGRCARYGGWAPLWPPATRGAQLRLPQQRAARRRGHLPHPLLPLLLGWGDPGFPPACFDLDLPSHILCLRLLLAVSSPLHLPPGLSPVGGNHLSFEPQAYPLTAGTTG